MSAQTRSKHRASKVFWRIVISAVGVSLILLALSNFTLYFFGETALASVTTRRVGGADNQYQPNQRYEWSVDYTFTDKKGAKYSGHTTMRGGDMGVKTDNVVYYFPFAPFINAMKSEAQPNISQPLFIVIGIFLLLVMNRKRNKPQPVSTVRNADDLKDYDDSVEELFHGED